MAIQCAIRRGMFSCSGEWHLHGVQCAGAVVKLLICAPPPCAISALSAAPAGWLPPPSGTGYVPIHPFRVSPSSGRRMWRPSIGWTPLRLFHGCRSCTQTAMAPALRTYPMRCLFAAVLDPLSPAFLIVHVDDQGRPQYAANSS